jgi:hypothetical protein
MSIITITVDSSAIPCSPRGEDACRGNGVTSSLRIMSAPQE